MHRVKLYKLNTQGLWDDKGTGHVAMEFLPVRLTLDSQSFDRATCEQLTSVNAVRSRNGPLMSYLARCAGMLRNRCLFPHAFLCPNSGVQRLPL